MVQSAVIVKGPDTPDIPVVLEAYMWHAPNHPCPSRLPWAHSYEKLESELGTDIHVDGGSHRVLLKVSESLDTNRMVGLLGQLWSVIWYFN